MSFKAYLKFVEIQTKLASIIPFLSGTAYAVYQFRQFNFIHFILMFISLICLDMGTTATNNYIDFVKAVKRDGFGFEEYNAMAKYHISKSLAIRVIFTLLFVATTFGIILFLKTNIVILFIGIVSFMICILYTFGPLPIATTPLSELISGVVEGGVLIFLAVYIHVFDSHVIMIVWNEFALEVKFYLLEILGIMLFSVSCTACISNIMLANNICDMEDDRINRRTTLPMVIGINRSLKLFGLLYLVSYLSFIALVVFGFISPLFLITLITFPKVYHNYKIFCKLQSKAETFALSVQNFALVNAVSLAVMVILILV